MKSEHNLHRGKELVLVVDPQTARRQQLVRGGVRGHILEAASLGEAFPMAEDSVPAVMALSGDLMVEPDLEGLIRLGDMLGSRMFLYSPEGRAPMRRDCCNRLPCIPLRPDDSMAALMARLADPRAHFQVSDADLRPPELVVIGASTGGIAAIESVLTAFPADCPPTLVVQHIRDGFVPGLVRRLNGCCRPRIVEARHALRLSRGTVYIAADPNCHLTVSAPAAPRCLLLDGPARNGHRPAVDPLFESAQGWGARVSAALLTGMGIDGAAGLAALRQAGAHTIAQDQRTSVVWGMPRAAIEAGAAAEVLPIDRIASALLAPKTRLSDRTVERAR